MALVFAGPAAREVVLLDVVPAATAMRLNLSPEVGPRFLTRSRTSRALRHFGPTVHPREQAEDSP